MNKPLERRESLAIEDVLNMSTSYGPGWLHRREIKWAGIGLTALLLTWLAWSYLHGAAPVRYTTEPVTRGNLTVIVTATGSLQPTNKVEVSSELSGTVRQVLVDYNSKVAARQTLAVLDTDKLQATVDSSRAKLVAARAAVTQAEATIVETEKILARKKALAGKQFASTNDVDVAQAAYDRAVAAVASAKADVGVAEADLQLNETNLAKATITSPISGIVLERNVDPGQTVASSLQAPVLFSIAEDLTQMELQVDVDEADVGKVRIGQNAEFSVDAFPDRRFPSRIDDVRFASETIQGVVTYKAVLNIDNSELLLRPGMTATAEIKVTEIDDTLLVPNAALRYTPPVADDAPKTSILRRILPGPPQFRAASRREEKGPERTVWVLRNGTAEAVAVVVGSSDGKMTEVRSGDLKAGDAVVTDQTTGTS